MYIVQWAQVSDKFIEVTLQVELHIGNIPHRQHFTSVEIAVVVRSHGAEAKQNDDTLNKSMALFYDRPT